MDGSKVLHLGMLRAVMLAILQWWGFDVTVIIMNKWIFQGFLDIKMRIWLRNLVTRCIANCPSLIVAIIGGTVGSGRLIVIASMILSFELPFALVPLLKFSSSSSKMGPLKNSVYIMVVSWVLGLCVIGINIYYLSTSFVTWIIHSSLPKPATVFIGVVVFPAMAFYVVSLIYLIFRKDTAVTFDEKLEASMEQGGRGANGGAEVVPSRDDLSPVCPPQ